MTTWQKFRFLWVLNWQYFRALLLIKDPMLITNGWGYWYIGPQAIRKLNITMKQITFIASVNQAPMVVEIPLTDVIKIIGDGEDINYDN